MFLNIKYIHIQTIILCFKKLENIKNLVSVFLFT